MMNIIFRNRKTFQSVFWNDSFDDTRQSLLPTQSELRSLRLLRALLALFLDATNVIEGQTYVTASMAHGIVLQLHSEPLEEVRKSHCGVLPGGLDPGQPPLKTLLLMLRLT